MSTVTSHTTAPIRSEIGQFQLHGFGIEGREHAALVLGSPDAEAAPLVRIQSACLTGAGFLSELCDCRQQLHAAMALIADHGSGVVLHLAQEGRGHGLVEKVAQLGLIADGLDTVEAAAARGVPEDIRDYGDAAAILAILLPSRPPIRMLTNSPTKMRGVRAVGVTLAERVPLEIPPSAGNEAYLLVKKERMGHLLELV